MSEAHLIKRVLLGCFANTIIQEIVRQFWTASVLFCMSLVGWSPTSSDCFFLRTEEPLPLSIVNLHCLICTTTWGVIYLHTLAVYISFD